MRTLFVFLVSITFTVGCTDSPALVESPFVIRDPDNTWTSDALQRGDINIIKERVLANSDYIYERDYIGDTPLLTAIEFGNLKLVQFLLEHDANPNIPVDDGYTCLLTAIESEADESTAIVDVLISAGADIHATGTNGWTPLHMAAARGHVEQARLLILVGADVNQRTEIDASETPLMEAAFTGQPATVRLLLENGADATMRDTMNNRTPLEIARDAMKGPDPDVINYLKQENIKVDVDEIFAGIDLPPDQLAKLEQSMKDIDMTQQYIDSSNNLVEAGNHAEVIRILTEHAARGR